MTVIVQITIEISDELLARAQEVVQDEATTLRSLIEEGLRLALDYRRRPRAFELRDASVGGDGLDPEFREGSWERIRDSIYRSRGG